MFIHLGNDVVITAQSLIAIINIEDPWSEDVQDVIDLAETERRLVTISDQEKKKALVICDDGVYISPISSQTLYKRANNFYREV
ncbi:MAG: OrfX [Firmicutes bacterium]|nr:OrfX [Bacillota bacterium]